MLCKIANFHKIGKFSELHFFLINQMRCCSRLGHLPYLIILKFTQIYVDGINLLTHLRRQIVIRNFPNKAKHCFVCTLLVVSQYWFDNDMVNFSKLLENFLSRHNNDSEVSEQCFDDRIRIRILFGLKKLTEYEYEYYSV